MKIAVMQPYFFPYLGYYQMVRAVDVFVFYDDVNYIRQGWINRNRILINGELHYLTVPCMRNRQSARIDEIQFNSLSKDFKKLTKTIQLAYQNAPYFDEVFPLIKEILNTTTSKISILSSNSITQICEYLGIKTQFKVSSLEFSKTKTLDRTDRLITICQNEGADHYINAIEGKELYQGSDFKKRGIELSFIKPVETKYKQFNNEFTPTASVIDVLMFNNKKTVRHLLDNYKLVS